MLALPCLLACSYPFEHSRTCSGTWNMYMYLYINVSIWCLLRHLDLQLLPSNREGLSYTFCLIYYHHLVVLGASHPSERTQVPILGPGKTCSLVRSPSEFSEEKYIRWDFPILKKSSRSTPSCVGHFSSIQGALSISVAHWSHQAAKWDTPFWALLSVSRRKVQLKTIWEDWLW